MKKYIKLLVILLLLSCQTEVIETDIPENTDITSKKIETFSKSYAKDQLVVRYTKNLSEKRKEALRKKYEVKSYKTCSCGSNIEQWTLGKDGLIEGRLNDLTEEEDVEGELNFLIELGDPIYASNSNGIEAQSDLIKNVNSGVTIAVIDTGLDYTSETIERFKYKFLYKTQKSCVDDGSTNYSGWDFVNDDNDVADDHGHGTVVIKEVYDRLIDDGVDFQILPIKAFDKNGIGTSFGVLCSTNLAIENNDVNIINMSFGWYNKTSQFLKDLMESTDKLIVTSAGNEGIDTDEGSPENLHYPSSHDFTTEENPDDHLLTVAAMNTAMDDLWISSNYGTQSIDIAAPGEDLDFYISNDTSILMSGTSFSCAIASAKAAKQYEENMTGIELKVQVLNSEVDVLPILSNYLLTNRYIPN